MTGQTNGQDESTVQSARLSFRSTLANVEKLVRLAREHGWLNAHGKPNISAMLNYIIDKFEEPSARREKKHGK